MFYMRCQRGSEWRLLSGDVGEVLNEVAQPHIQQHTVQWDVGKLWPWPQQRWTGARGLNRRGGRRCVNDKWRRDRKRWKDCRRGMAVLISAEWARARAISRDQGTGGFCVSNNKVDPVAGGPRNLAGSTCIIEILLPQLSFSTLSVGHGESLINEFPRILYELGVNLKKAHLTI